jgi:hypothetical protein
VVATMGIKKSSAVVKEQLIQLKSIEVDEVIEIKEVKEVTLTLVKIGKKKICIFCNFISLIIS